MRERMPSRDAEFNTNRMRKKEEIDIEYKRIHGTACGSLQAELLCLS